MSKRLTEEKNRRLEEVVRLRYEEEGGRKLAKELGVCLPTVRSRAEKLGIKTKITCHESQKINCKTVDIHFFEQWTPEVAYLLGYIWTDGCLKENGGNSLALTFGCKKEDGYLLYKIKEILKSKHKVGERKGGRRVVCGKECNVQDQVRLCITNTYLVQSILDRYGFKFRKSFYDNPFPDLPEGNLNHFFRGVFDGDGSIANHSVKKGLWRSNTLSMMGTKTFITELRDRVSLELEISKNKISMGKNGSSILVVTRWSDFEELKKIYGWMYTDLSSDLYLKRKKEYFEEKVFLKRKMKYCGVRRTKYFKGGEEKILWCVGFYLKHKYFYGGTYASREDAAYASFLLYKKVYGVNVKIEDEEIQNGDIRVLSDREVEDMVNSCYAKLRDKSKR